MTCCTLRAMSAVIKQGPNFFRSLAEHPERREALRLVVLSEELLALPKTLRRTAQVVERIGNWLEEGVEEQKIIAQLQKHPQEALDRLSLRLDPLAGQIHQHDLQIQRLTEQMQQLTQQVQLQGQQVHQLTQRMEELALAQRRTADQVAGLTEAVKTKVHSIIRGQLTAPEDHRPVRVREEF